MDAQPPRSRIFARATEPKDARTDVAKGGEDESPLPESGRAGQTSHFEDFASQLKYASQCRRCRWMLQLPHLMLPLLYVLISGSSSIASKHGSGNAWAELEHALEFCEVHVAVFPTRQVTRILNQGGPITALPSLSVRPIPQYTHRRKPRPPGKPRWRRSFALRRS